MAQSDEMELTSIVAEVIQTHPTDPIPQSPETVETPLVKQNTDGVITLHYTTRVTILYMTNIATYTILATDDTSLHDDIDTPLHDDVDSAVTTQVQTELAVLSKIPSHSEFHPRSPSDTTDVGETDVGETDVRVIPDSATLSSVSSELGIKSVCLCVSESRFAHAENKQNINCSEKKHFKSHPRVSVTILTIL